MTKQIKKVPAGLEDLALGRGKVSQLRGETSLPISQVDALWLLDSAAQIRELDTQKVTKVYREVDGVFDLYTYNSALAETDDGEWVLQPATGVGRWIKSLGNFESTTPGLFSTEYLKGSVNALQQIVSSLPTAITSSLLNKRVSVLKYDENSVESPAVWECVTTNAVGGSEGLDTSTGKFRVSVGAFFYEFSNVSKFIDPLQFGLTASTFNTAFTAAFSATDTVYLADYDYVRAGSGGGVGFTVPEGKNLVALGKKATLTCTSYPIMQCLGDNRVEGIHFDNSNGGVSIGVEIRGDNVTIKSNKFTEGNQIIYVYGFDGTSGSADGLLVEDNDFLGCGYQVLQKGGYASNDGRVINNRSIDCTTDFVELNSTSTAPSKNWLVANNYVKNVGMVGATTAKTESRFFGCTATDGVLITGNIVEACAGDSMLHFESVSKNIVITNNIFIDPQGAFGPLLFLTNGASISTVNFSDNIVRLSSGYTRLTNTASKLSYLVGNDNARLQARNNVFINESTYTDVEVFDLSDTEDTYITGNRFVDVKTGVITGIGGGVGGPRKAVHIKENLFEDCDRGTYVRSPISSGRHYSVFIEENTYNNCTEVFEHEYSDSLPISLNGNHVRNGSNIDEAVVIGDSVINPQVYGNRVESGATTTRASSQGYSGVDIGTAIKIFDFNPTHGYGSVMVHVKATDSAGNVNSNNSRAEVVRIDVNSPIDKDLTSINVSSSGAGATFTLSLNGNDLEFTASAERAYQVSIVGSFLPEHTSHP